MSDNLFLSKMTHKCTISEKGMDGYGKETEVVLFSNQVCFFEWQQQVIIDEKKEKVQINGFIFLPPIDIDVNCERYTFTQTFPEIRDVGYNYQIMPLHDPNTGVLHHYEVWMR